MFDYEEIISNLKTDYVIELMKKLGADRYKETNDYIIFPTICHNVDPSEASMKLYFYKNSKLFHCYTSCGSMSIFKFLKEYYSTRNIEYDWYTDIYQVIVDCSTYIQKEFTFKTNYVINKNNYSKRREEKELSSYNEGVLDTFVKIYPQEWIADGISNSAMDRFEIAYSISQKKIIIPHRDINGRLIGIRGRSLDEWEIENIGKYIPVKIEQTIYKHPLGFNLYGLYQNKENILKNKVCYVCESEKAVLQIDSFNIPNCAVAVCGSNFNKFQLNLLLKYCAPSEIIFCFDKEEKPKEDIYFNKLYSLCKKYSQYTNLSFIYDRNNLISLKESPTDKGEEVFLKLLERRIKVK